MARIFRPSAKTKIPQTLQLTIERLSDDGRGVAKQNGKTVFVSGGLPHERVEAKVVQQSSRFDQAIVTEVLQTSEARETPSCKHYGQCGGCDLQHLHHSHQLSHKQAVFEGQLKHWGAGIQVEEWLSPIVSSPFGYRQRVRLSVAKPKSGQQLGFRQRESKSIVAIKQCPIMEPSIESLLPLLNQWIKTYQPAVSHIEMVVDDTSVGIVIRHTSPISVEQRGALAELISDDVHCWFQGEAKGRLTGSDGQPTEPRLNYGLQGLYATLQFHPQDFIQGNRRVNQQMVSQALELLSPKAGDVFLDLFSGIGNFSIPLSKRCKQVVAVEGVDEMVNRGRENAALNQQNNIEFRQADLAAENSLKVLLKKLNIDAVDGVLLDPPRSGADIVCRQIGALNPAKVLYVSCNSATFVRDAEILNQAGYVLSKAGIIDMFPQTAHSEVMGLFVKPGITL